MRRNVGVVAARLGSTRLVAKNVRLIGGRPSLCWVLEALVSALGIRGEVVVSVEPDGRGDQVERFVRAHCAAFVTDRVGFHKRPIELCEPQVGLREVVDEVLSHMDGRSIPGDEPGQVTIALATAALLRPEDIREMIHRSMGDNNAYMMVTRMYLDPNATLLLAQDGGLYPPERPLAWNAEQLLDHQRKVIDAGMCYTYPRALWDAEGFYPSGGKLRPFPLRRTDAVDVDEEEDARLLELLFAAQHTRNVTDFGNWRPNP